MNAYKRVNRLFEVISIGTAIAITKQVIDLLSTSVLIQNSPLLSWGTSIVLVILLNELFVHMFQMFYEQFRPLRRFLLGNQYVEGTWIEYIVKDHRVISMGIVSIETNEYELRIHGQNFDLNGNLCYDFSSRDEMVNIEWPILRYVYEDRPFQGNRNSVQGVSHIKFSASEDRPRMYTGSFTHVGAGSLTGLEGRLIVDKGEIQALNDPTQMRQVMKKYLEHRLQETGERTQVEQAT